MPDSSAWPPAGMSSSDGRRDPPRDIGFPALGAAERGHPVDSVAGSQYAAAADRARTGGARAAGPRGGLCRRQRRRAERKSGVEGKSVSVRVDLRGGRIIQKKKQEE